MVRDKKAHIIRDLRPEEVQVLENGVPQTVRGFEFVDGHSTPQVSSAATPAASSANPVVPSVVEHEVNELRDISVVSVVIGSMGPDPRGRKLALEAIRKFIKDELQPNTYVGVFRLYHGDLWVAQPYTNDAEKISNGVERAVRATSATPVTPGPTASQADANATGPAAAIAR